MLARKKTPHLVGAEWALGMLAFFHSISFEHLGSSLSSLSCSLSFALSGQRLCCCEIVRDLSVCSCEFFEPRSYVVELGDYPGGFGDSFVLFSDDGDDAFFHSSHVFSGASEFLHSGVTSAHFFIR